MLGRMTLAAGVCAALLVGCGSSSSASSSAASSGQAVTLAVGGGTGNLNGVECGKQEAFEHYDFPAQVTYSGTVNPAPSGRWKVKLKLKRCNGWSFVDADS